MKAEVKKIFISILTSLLILLILAFWRIFEIRTAIFIQIFISSLFLLSILYLLRYSRVNLKSFNGNEMISIIIGMLLVLFLILNIERSRSIFLLKWVEAAGRNGITISELSIQKDLSKSDLNAIIQRVEEQDQTGFLFTKNERIYISSSGKILVFFFASVARFERLEGYVRS